MQSFIILEVGYCLIVSRYVSAIHVSDYLHFVRDVFVFFTPLRRRLNIQIRNRHHAERKMTVTADNIPVYGFRLASHRRELNFTLKGRKLI